MLVLSLLQDLHRLVEILDFHCAADPLVVVVAQRLPVKHVSNAFKFADLLPAAPNSLLYAHLFLLGELVRQVLVLIHDVFSHHHHLHVDALVSPFLPLHEGMVEPTLVLADQAQLHPVHVVLVMLAVLLPDHQSAVLHVAVPQVRSSHQVVLRLRRGLFIQALSLVLKLLTLRDLLL